MRRMLVLLTLAAVLWLLLPGSVLRATPTPPYTIVNHATKQCAESILGDDCHWCDPPPGWEVLGPAAGNQCPAGYARLDRLDMNCVGYKNQFCCSGGSHRGDCDDLVIHEAQRLCAFVEEISDCALPQDWTQWPADLTAGSWVCPYDYQWVDDVACLSATETLEVAATLEPSPTPEAPPTAAPPPAATLRRTLVWLAVPVVAAALLGSLVWALRRRTGDGGR